VYEARRIPGRGTNKIDVEHLTEKQVEEYSLRQVPAADLLALSDHLAACETCRRRIEGVNDVAFFALHEETLAEGSAASAHLSAEQTADYVDKNLSGEALQVVNDHLTTCERCVLAVKDLRAFRNEIAPSLDRHFGPTPGSTSVPAAATNGWRGRFVSLFKVTPVPAFASAAVAVLLLAAIAWLVWRTPPAEKQEVAVAPSPVSQPTASVEPSAPPPAPVEVVAELRDGGAVLSLDQEGKLAGADALPPAYQNLVKKALSTQRIERSSQLQGLTRPPSALMGANDQVKEFSVLEPAGNVLLSNQPAFRWSALEGATAYVVEVYDDQYKLVASSPQLTGRSWTITQPLARGKIYSWQVKASTDGAEVTTPRPPAPQAKFRVLDEAKTNELAKARRAYGSSHLTLGLLYAEAGLLKEAEQQFLLLRRANPDSELARKLHQQTRALMVRQ
jgi:hypothetical protein